MSRPVLSSTLRLVDPVRLWVSSYASLGNIFSVTKAGQEEGLRECKIVKKR